MKRSAIVIYAVGGLALVGSCMNNSNGGVTTGRTEGGGEATYNAEDGPACRHFNNILADIDKGILTDAEVRGKITEVRESAVTEPVKAAATKLLAGFTQHNTTKIKIAGAELVSACKLHQ